MSDEDSRIIGDATPEDPNQKPILESGLSRIHDWISKHDCAIISAFRGNPNGISRCVNPDPNDKNWDPVFVSNAAKKNFNLNSQFFRAEGYSITNAINVHNTKNLDAALIYLGYGTINIHEGQVKSISAEVAKHIPEGSRLVVNHFDREDGDFSYTIRELGRKFCQDSVIIIPKGGSKTCIFGTNNAEWPGFNNRINLGPFFIGSMPVNEPPKAKCRGPDTKELTTQKSIGSGAGHLAMTHMALSILYEEKHRGN